MKKILSIIIIGTILGSVVYAGIALANVSFFSRVSTNQTLTCTGVTSTSTYSYVVGGFGTSTVTIDTGCGSNSGADTVTLLTQVQSSSTPATASSTSVKFRVEYSQDNVDWYPQLVALNTTGTTTVLTQSYPEFLWNASSTSATSGTDFGGSSTSTVRFYGAYGNIPVWTRYVRVKLYVPMFSGGGALYAELVGKKQPTGNN